MTRQVLSTWDAGTDVSVAELLVSELVTNGYVHGVPPLSLSMQLRGETVLVGVSDGSSTAPTPTTPAIDAEGGRGLLLVEALATQWMVETTGPTKTIWFELPTAAVTAGR